MAKSFPILSALLIIPIFVLLGSATAYGCTCENKPALDESYNKASLIFVGQVKAKAHHPLREDKIEFRFAVTRKIKGFEEVNGNTVFVYTPRDHEYCGYKFQEGQDYLVYADGTPANFNTTACTRTDVLDKSLLDVQKLIRMSGAIPDQKGEDSGSPTTSKPARRATN